MARVQSQYFSSALVIWTHQRVVLDVNDAEENSIVDVWNTISSPTHCGAQKRCGVMELDAIHLGTDDPCKTVMGRRVRIHGAQCQTRHVFVNLLRDQ